MQKTIINNLEKIRQQPEHVRRHVLHVSTGVCAVVLVFLWILSLGSALTNETTQNKITQDLKPFSTLKSSITDGYDSLTE